MKKISLVLLTLFLLVSLPGCALADAGKVKSFLKEAEGVWYVHGNSKDEMLKITEDGKWEYYSPENGMGGRTLTDSGTIAYNTDYKIYDFTTEDITYPCEPVKNGVLVFKSINFITGEESGDLNNLNGNWYLDGDSSKDYYSFAGGEWQFFEASGGGHSSVDYGNLDYRGGDKQELTAGVATSDSPFATFSIAGSDEIRSDGRVYLRIADSDLPPDEPDDSDITTPSTAISLSGFYYLDGDTTMDSLYFYSDNTVDYDSADTDTMEGTYYIEGNILTNVFGNNMAELTI